MANVDEDMTNEVDNPDLNTYVDQISEQEALTTRFTACELKAMDIRVQNLVAKGGVVADGDYAIVNTRLAEVAGTEGGVWGRYRMTGELHDDMQGKSIAQLKDQLLQMAPS